jgi:putative transposase
MKYAFIERHRAEWPVCVQCSVLGVSVNGYRKYLRRRRSCNASPGNGGRVTGMELPAHIRAIHGETRGAYGWPRMWREPRGRGVRVGKERVRKMMKENAIRARAKRRFKATTDSDHNLPVCENPLNRNFKPERPDTVWTGCIWPSSSTPSAVNS